jgi:hypothetical protein
VCFNDLGALARLRLPSLGRGPYGDRLRILATHHIY